MTITTVADLLELLEQYEPDQPVMIAHQPSWPLAETLAGVTSLEETDVESDDDAEDREGEDLRTVWLVAGGARWDRSPYAPRAVFSEC